jgi:hypothetical protein
MDMLRQALQQAAAESPTESVKNPVESTPMSQPQKTKSVDKISTQKKSAGAAASASARNSGQKSEALSVSKKSSRKKSRSSKLTPEQKARMHEKLFEAAQSALSDAGFPNQMDDKFPAEIDGLCILPVRTEEVSGYLTVCFENVSTEVRSEIIFDFSRGLTIRFDTLELKTNKMESFWLPWQEQRFDQIVKENTFYFKTANYGDSSVGVAFFPTENDIPDTDGKSGQPMIDIWVEDIECCYPLNFKAYLYLQKNQKYYLYLRNGRSLQPEQKLRLSENGVEKMHIKKIDQKNYRIFLASAYFNLLKNKAS